MVSQWETNIPTACNRTALRKLKQTCVFMAFALYIMLWLEINGASEPHKSKTNRIFFKATIVRITWWQWIWKSPLQVLHFVLHGKKNKLRRWLIEGTGRSVPLRWYPYHVEIIWFILSPKLRTNFVQCKDHIRLCRRPHPQPKDSKMLADIQLA